MRDGRGSWRLRAAIAAVAAVVAACPAPAGAVPGQSWEAVGGGPVAESSQTLSPDSPDHRSYDLKRINGSLDVAWTEWDGDNHRIRVARLSADGQSWDRLGGIVNVDDAKDALDPSLAAGPDGAPWIAWTEVDAAGARQVRVARYDASSGRWVEPDGRDWQINYRPEGSPASDRPVYAARSPRLIFIGARPYVVYLQWTPSGAEIDVVRLAGDGHSWERVARDVATTEPRGVDAAVVDGLLHVGTTSHWTQGVVARLNSNGSWEQVGGAVNEAVVDDETGNPRTGRFNRIVDYGGKPHVLWTTNGGPSPYYHGLTYVLRPGDGGWELANEQSVGGPGGTSLGSIAGDLYAASSSALVAEVPEVRVYRLDHDGGYDSLSNPTGEPADFGAVLSALGGVPYVAWVRDDGTTNALVVERLVDGQLPPAEPDGYEGSGPGTDPEVDAEPILPPREQPEPPRGPCAATLTGTPGDDRLLGGPRADCLLGEAGDDVLRGRDGEDRLRGGPGDDSLHGGPDEDRLAGGHGADLLWGGPGWDVFRGGPGRDEIYAADGRGESVDCGDGQDTLRADRYDRPRGCEHVRVVGG